MLVFVLLRLPILIQSGSNLGQPRCASFENFTDFSIINKKTALICSIKTVFLLVLPKWLVAEVGFEPHDLRVMRCRRRRKLFPQAAFRCFSIHLSGEIERSICFRVHLFHAVLSPYGSSYGSGFSGKKRHSRRKYIWVKSMGQFTPRPGTIFGTDIKEQTKEKKFIKADFFYPICRIGSYKTERCKKCTCFKIRYAKNTQIALTNQCKCDILTAE